MPASGGRGHNNRGHHGGRGGGNNSRNSRNRQSSRRRNSQQQQPKSNKIFKFHPNGSKEEKYADFAAIKNRILMTLRQDKDFNDPHEVLTQLQDEVDLSPQEPQESIRRVNNGELQYFITDENNQDVLLDEFGLKQYLQDKSRYDSLKPKFDTTNRAVAAKIYNAYCTFDCKTALRNLPNFDTVVQFDTILLMAAIRNIVYTGTHTQHPWKLYCQIEKLALAPTHRPNESIETYIKRHGTDYDRYRDIIGWDALDDYITTFPDYQAIDANDAAGQAAFIQDARQEHQTHCLLLGIPEGRYGNYLNDLSSSYALGAHIDNYPKTATQLREALQL